LALQQLGVTQDESSALPRANLGHSIDIASHTLATTGSPSSLATAGKQALMDQLTIQVGRASRGRTDAR
jgi:hypothetical protein